MPRWFRVHLIRQIALCIEAADDQIDSANIEIAGYSSEQVGLHCAFMEEGGLIVAEKIAELDPRFSELMIQRLTWKGCDFIDAARDSTIWKKAMRQVKQAVLSMVFDDFLKRLRTLAESAVQKVAEAASQ